MSDVSRYRYMAGILDALRSIGRSATVNEVYRWLIEQGRAKADDLKRIQKDGGSRFMKEVRWARKELFDAGHIAAPAAGLWQITNRGLDAHLTPDDARAIVRDNRHRRLGRKA